MIETSSPIFLWGFMGAGKSRLGKRLAPKLQRKFIDLDHFIEEKTQQSIVSLFQELGENGFRKLEAQCIQTVSSQENVIISCGGGTPCFFDNKTKMLQSGLVIYLTVEENELIQRLWRNRTSRPLIASLGSEEELALYLERKLTERNPYYKTAHFEYDNTYPRTDLSNLIETIESMLHK